MPEEEKRMNCKQPNMPHERLPELIYSPFYTCWECLKMIYRLDHHFESESTDRMNEKGYKHKSFKKH